LVNVNIVFKRYSSLYCLMQCCCFICRKNNNSR